MLVVLLLVFMVLTLVFVLVFVLILRVLLLALMLMVVALMLMRAPPVRLLKGIGENRIFIFYRRENHQRPRH